MINEKNPDSDQALDAIKELIKKGRSFVVASHVNPDGDALGSSLALALCLEQLGKEVVIFNMDVVPEMLRFLPGSERVTNTLPEDRVDALFSVDAGEFSMLGKSITEGRFYQKLVNIDHHLTNAHFGDLNFIDPKASSTGQIVYNVISALGCTLNPAIATNVYCTIVTDTGSFRHANTTPEAMRIAALMIENGANPKEVAEHLYEQFPRGRLELFKRVLATLETDFSHRYASIVLFQKDLEDLHLSPEWAEGFIDALRATKGVEVVAFFKETDKNKFKVSMRSKGSINVAKICSSFKGGGHFAAAGCKLEGPLQAVKKQLSDAVRAELGSA